MERDIRMAVDRWKRADEFARSEVGMTFVGVVLDSVFHMIAESVFDKLLETRYPEKYTLYSTGLSAGILTTVGLSLAVYGGRIRWYVMQYIGWGMVFSEVSSWMDMVRLSFEIKR
ncbi:unnamed protein product [marine sediment metagenome]|uniref:Uncharacterized protein n=1 Tax=marine sediment metagenome TaxID=412755 RepID=X1IME8_9ZZZZ